jgi:hypothetical protein
MAFGDKVFAWATKLAAYTVLLVLAGVELPKLVGLPGIPLVGLLEIIDRRIPLLKVSFCLCQKKKVTGGMPSSGLPPDAIKSSQSRSGQSFCLLRLLSSALGLILSLTRIHQSNFCLKSVILS